MLVGTVKAAFLLGICCQRLRQNQLLQLEMAIAVKGNQKNLHREIRHNTENTTPTSRYITAEKNRNRVTGSQRG